ncbi:MAG: 30S ribosome-binding factor RbfA [Firmicutes bacterium]|nr:30S ribosome-binding factor RbfA [Bacillota bacterium]
MGKGYRQGRIGEEIRKIISDMLLRGLKDPRLDTMISITAVEVTNDNSYATVFFSKLGISSDPEIAQEQKQELIDAFASAKGFIRNEIAKKMKLRHVPELIFKYDTSLEYGRHIEEIISTLDK